MKHRVKSLLFILSILTTSTAFAHTCSTPLKGTNFSQDTLNPIIEQHEKWVSNHREPANDQVNLCGTVLTGLNLKKKSLSYSDFSGSDLSNTQLNNTDLTYSNLLSTNFKAAKLHRTDFSFSNLMLSRLDEAEADHALFKQSNITEANFTKTILANSDFSGVEGKNAIFTGATLHNSHFNWGNLISSSFNSADLNDTTFSNSRLSNVDFTNARLKNTNFENADLRHAKITPIDITNANFAGANLKHAIFQPQLGTLPDLLSLTQAKNFHTVHLEDINEGIPTLIEMRSAFKQLHLQHMQRIITSIIKREEMVDKLNTGGWSYFGGSISYALFYLTSDFGASPARPLYIILGLILLLSIPYRFALTLTSKHQGIKQQLHLLVLSIYFSMLNTFSIYTGLLRIHKREFTLTGLSWIKVLSGLQSILCMYLIVLWVLTYFGSPFTW